MCVRHIGCILARQKGRNLGWIIWWITVFISISWVSSAGSIEVVEMADPILDPDGDFVEAIGRQHSAENAAKIIVDHMSDWKGSQAG